MLVEPPVEEGKLLERVVVDGGAHSNYAILFMTNGDTYEMELEDLRLYLKVIGCGKVEQLVDSFWNFGRAVWVRSTNEVLVRPDSNKLSEDEANRQLRQYEALGEGGPNKKVGGKTHHG